MMLMPKKVLPSFIVCTMFARRIYLGEHICCTISSVVSPAPSEQEKCHSNFMDCEPLILPFFFRILHGLHKMAISSAHLG